MKQLIITVIGKDKTGLVEQLSDTVYNNHANWLKSSLTQLSGQFAGIVQVEVSPQHIQQLSDALSQISGLQIHIVEAQIKASSQQQMQKLTVTGNDRLGIVKDVTTHLHQLGINIYKLKTKTESAPNWGYPIFTAQFQLDLPTDLTIDTVQEQLELLADDLTIDVEQ
ncbi:amino acid-binding protein [Photobacterium angustum]|uniref:glycine cleavage system protein R n=1 Tax=Photobacterium angustum TaxID=661 RepID=UPI0005E7B9F5|nr:ACT domain-containing protein [Photobacterium angustum]KJF93129.1 amino acid-binding protein [Photobacterium angustum]KJG07066.1 amino acid-binding protein [Photobacterium angustum]PSV90147.1 amino acid-binding protein [Photobacterium angustum]PSW83319.1 amino acid-binding protein [Photobacterium angustum]